MHDFEKIQEEAIYHTVVGKWLSIKLICHLKLQVKSLCNWKILVGNDAYLCMIWMSIFFKTLQFSIVLDVCIRVGRLPLNWSGN